MTRVDWKHPAFLCHMPCDIHVFFGEGDINHFNNILQDDQNDFTFFHQLGLLSAYLQVAPLGSDDAHTYRQIPQIAHQFAFECHMVVKIFSPSNAKTRKSITPLYM